MTPAVRRAYRRAHLKLLAAWTVACCWVAILVAAFYLWVR